MTTLVRGGLRALTLPTPHGLRCNSQAAARDLALLAESSDRHGYSSRFRYALS
jgi:hypothetical protein